MQRSPGSNAEQLSLYRAFLLRCWCEGLDAESKDVLWRVSIEEIFGERRQLKFASVDAFYAYLKDRLMEEGWTTDDERE